MHVHMIRSQSVLRMSSDISLCLPVHLLGFYVHISIQACRLQMLDFKSNSHTFKSLFHKENQGIFRSSHIHVYQVFVVFLSRSNVCYLRVYIHLCEINTPQFPKQVQHSKALFTCHLDTDYPSRRGVRSFQQDVLQVDFVHGSVLKTVAGHITTSRSLAQTSSSGCNCPA